jgi:hypothetical protein
MKSGKKFYLEQLAMVGAGDIDGILEKHYHKDAVMVTFDGVRKGHKELREYYENTFASIGQITAMSTDYFEETEDSIIFKSTITDSKRGTVKADNAFFMKDGKIFRHLSLTLLPVFDYEKHGTTWKDE